MYKTILCILVLLFAAFPLIAQDEEEDDESVRNFILPISMYLLVDDIDDPNPDISTSRTESDLRQIWLDVSDIWSQANIVIDLKYAGYVEVPTDILEDIIMGDFQSFFDAINDGTIEIPDISLFNGFYAKKIGLPNGISLSNRVFLVQDNPTVLVERTTSHEIGHLLGLHHELEDEERLMYSGTNGMNLTEEEIIVSRYIANGFLMGLRYR